MRVNTYTYGAIGGVVDITDGWNAVRLKGDKLDVIEQLVRLQYDLSVALNDVSEWEA